MAALLIVLGFVAVALWCHAYMAAIGVIVLLISAVWHSPGRNHQQQTMHNWHKRNR